MSKPRVDTLKKITQPEIKVRPINLVRAKVLTPDCACGAMNGSKVKIHKKTKNAKAV